MLSITGETGAGIRYTLDGTEPSKTNGTLYAGRVAITLSATVKAIAYQDGHLDSEIAAYRFWIMGRREVRDQAIVLTGDQVMEINDTWFIMRNNIVLRDRAKLIIRDSVMQHQKDYLFQYSIDAFGSSQVVIERSAVHTNCTGSFNWNFFDQASLNGDIVTQLHCNTYHYFTHQSSAVIRAWDGFSFTLCERTNVSIERSSTIEAELCYPSGSVLDEALPQKISSLTLPGPRSSGVGWRLQLKDSVIDQWGIGLVPRTSVTIRDAHALSISVVVGNPWQNETVTLEGIRPRLYQDTTFRVVDTTLRLVNSKVEGWEINAFGTGNTLIIRDSEYTGSAINSGNAKYIIENTTLYILRGQENVEMTLRNCRLVGDAVATENSKITLINSTVAKQPGGSNGNVFASGNGVVTLVNTVVEGEKRTEGNGRIVVQ